MPVPISAEANDMDLICFTKLLEPYGADELIGFARKTGLAGYDLTVRDGHPVTSETIGTDLVPFVGRLRDAGLQVPLATIGWQAMPPGDPATETAWAACAEAGIGMIKLGYWHWTRGGPHYWDQVESVRAELHQYAKLAEKFGVKAVIHTSESSPTALANWTCVSPTNRRKAATSAPESKWPPIRRLRRLAGSAFLK